MMLEVCPCNLPHVHGEHIYEWDRTREFILCPGRTEPEPQPGRLDRFLARVGWARHGRG
jgi:hypothetical protein